VIASVRAARLGPVLSLVGLVAVLAVTIQIYGTWTPTLGAAGASPTTAGGGRTWSPSPGIVKAATTVPGTLVYVRDGELWVQAGTAVRRITVSENGSSASGPAWSGDGLWIYYVDTRIGTGRWFDPNNGFAIVDYQLTYPVLCRIHPDGTGQEEILSGMLKNGTLRSFFWIREPSVSPSGSTVAVISDGPTWPTVADNMVHFVALPSGKLGPAIDVPVNSPLGLSEPAYSPDGKLVAYVMEGRSGKYGAPGIWVYDTETRTTRRVAAGYRDPFWSPDGKYLAATEVDRDRLDVVVLDAASGAVVGRVTSDGASWGAVWSPAGDAMVYMGLQGSNVRLRMVRIEGEGSTMSFRLEADLTDYSGLDGSSRAAWYIPGVNSPVSTPSPYATPSPSVAG
jgi:Tol biopolymer transport system component